MSAIFTIQLIDSVPGLGLIFNVLSQQREIRHKESLPTNTGSDFTLGPVRKLSSCVINNVIAVGQDLSTLGAADFLTWLCAGDAGGFRRLKQELELVGFVVLESKVEVARVSFHQPIVEPLVELQLVDKSIIRPGLRPQSRQHLQHVRDRGTTTRVEEPGGNNRDTSTDSVSNIDIAENRV